MYSICVTIFFPSLTAIQLKNVLVPLQWFCSTGASIVSLTYRFVENHALCLCLQHTISSKIIVALVETQKMMGDWLRCMQPRGNFIEKIKVTKVEQAGKRQWCKQRRWTKKNKQLQKQEGGNGGSDSNELHQTRVADFNFQSFNHCLSVKCICLCMNWNGPRQLWHFFIIILFFCPLFHYVSGWERHTQCERVC